MERAGIISDRVIATLRVPPACPSRAYPCANPNLFPAPFGLARPAGEAIPPSPFGLATPAGAGPAPAPFGIGNGRAPVPYDAVPRSASPERAAPELRASCAPDATARGACPMRLAHTPPLTVGTPMVVRVYARPVERVPKGLIINVLA